MKVAVITGGGSGIGWETSKLFAEHDFKVIVSDLKEVNEEQLSQLSANGNQAKFIATDVSKYDEVKNLIDKTIAEYGKIDVLVNNAGIGPSALSKTDGHTLEDWDKVISVNQSGVFYGMKVALGHMVNQGYGNIVNVASLAGIRGRMTGLCYSASKFAVVGMTKSAALEYARQNIRINCVCPAFTETPLFNEAYAPTRKGLKEKLLRAIPQGRFAQPREIAEAILWLASDKSTFMTGEAMILDGGLSA